jgi:membrane-bound metal-dependent hydrolase YbcI (DUF457 family)
MKGFSHFMSGVAVASFCPWSIEAALNGNPIFFVLGGACGILPDTLDFKFYRFFYNHDVYVTPDPGQPDPQYVANEVARAVDLAVDENRYVNLKLVSIRLGADFWQQYTVKFDNEKKEVSVKFGAVVNTGQVPVPGTENQYPQVARAKLKAKVIQTYDAALKVDIFDGPTVGLKPMANGDLDLEFLPWHREWSHSLTIGLLLGVIFAVLAFFVAGWAMAWQGLVTIAACYGVHVVEDQLGHMGANLFYPFTKTRTPGLHWMHSGDGLPNFLAVWICCLLIFWNLYQGQPKMTYHFSFLHLMMVGLVIPGLVMGGIHWLLTRGQRAAAAATAPEAQADDEWSETKASG